jgi:putative endonuclease
LFVRRYYVSILTNRRYGVLYIGLTSDLHRRMSQHRSKGAPGFTREYDVIRLVYFEEYASRASGASSEGVVRGSPPLSTKESRIAIWRKITS